MTIREQQQLEEARSFPVDVLAQAAIYQAKQGRLSEAQAHEIAGAFGEAGEIARVLRSRTQGRQLAELV